MIGSKHADQSEIVSAPDKCCEKLGNVREGDCGAALARDEMSGSHVKICGESNLSRRNYRAEPELEM